MAIYFMAMYMCGASLGPLLTGKLIDVLAHRAAALASYSRSRKLSAPLAFGKPC